MKYEFIICIVQKKSQIIKICLALNSTDDYGLSDRILVELSKLTNRKCPRLAYE